MHSAILMPPDMNIAGKAGSRILVKLLLQKDGSTSLVSPIPPLYRSIRVVGTVVQKRPCLAASRGSAAHQQNLLLGLGTEQPSGTEHPATPRAGRCCCGIVTNRRLQPAADHSSVQGPVSHENKRRYLVDCYNVDANSNYEDMRTPRDQYVRIVQ